MIVECERCKTWTSSWPHCEGFRDVSPHDVSDDVLIAYARKMVSSVYLTTDKPVAKDISEVLRELAYRLEGRRP